MKETIHKFLLLAIFICMSVISYGQEIVTDIEDQLEVNNLKEKLLPLNELLTLAERHSPLLKMIDADIHIQDLRIKSEKKDWLSFFSVTGTAKYGMFENLIVTDEFELEDSGASSSTKQTRYTVGMSLKVPLNEIFNKLNRDVALSEKMKLQYQKTETISELRKLVITQYGNLLRAHSKLIIKTSELETVKMKMIDTEVNYRNGKLSLGDFTNQKSEILKLQLAYEETKIEFIVAVHILQETIGVSLNLNPKI
ncbi:TolC family protein [Marinifilum sp. RC60d5]|uniref:TolC family protein n=1 Tax=Marinifilum sp. RC60d5 TaxID=3458414 RepID=UPI004036D804